MNIRRAAALLASSAICVMVPSRIVSGKCGFTAPCRKVKLEFAQCEAISSPAYSAADKSVEFTILARILEAEPEPCDNRVVPTPNREWAERINSELHESLGKFRSCRY